MGMPLVEEEKTKLWVNYFRYGGLWPEDYKNDNDSAGYQGSAFLASPYVAGQPTRMRIMSDAS
jgi:hypothetical protein